MMDMINAAINVISVADIVTRLHRTATSNQTPGYPGPA